MNFRQLEVFHAIMMSSGSLTKAARLLNVTQPSISAILKQTEDQLGLPLFKRVSGRLVATADAETLFLEADRIFGQLRVFKRVSKDLREGRNGLLALIGHPTLANILLMRAATRYRTKRPQLRLRLESGVANEISDRIARREFDLGLVYGFGGDIDTSDEIVGYAEIGCAMRIDHPLANHAQIRGEDLAGHDVITFYRGSPVRTKIEDQLRECGTELNATIEVSCCTTACTFALEGAGVALVDPVAVRTGAFPSLTVIPFAPKQLVPLRLIHPRNRAPSQLSVEFVDVLKEVVSTYYPAL